MDERTAPNRRDFLTGNAIRSQLQNSGGLLDVGRSVPSRGPTLLLRTTAMACDFDVMLNPEGSDDQIGTASEGLDLVHSLEQMMTIYRDDSVLTGINRQAGSKPIAVDEELFQLLLRGRQITELTDCAFDPAAGALVSLWRDCRKAERIPTPEEVETALSHTGVRHFQFHSETCTLQRDRDHVEFNLGAIGKGYAVDRLGQHLTERGVCDWLVHGGRSSIRAQGTHAGLDGWPVGLRNPLLPDRPYATLLLKDAALGTSGTAVQWFRHAGKRYGHILDPRTGWPVESMLSVSVVAPDAALADALSTAFFVLGVENALKCCDNFPQVGAIFFPPPLHGRNLCPIVHNVPADRIFLEDE